MSAIRAGKYQDSMTDLRTVKYEAVLIVMLYVMHAVQLYYVYCTNTDGLVYLDHGVDIHFYGTRAAWMHGRPELL